ncbi:uncharacterized protein LOC112665388 isoform X3 [Canis lupus dingo]|uniref:uncharacterized protein LOC112665388 isoform X3 n=1 Tax=Canis lupus dingo TaxID=286419 RepID=UPI0020C45940|nr:uncharacterized protein LOC112665388 isoform X3 [Canis lupus dingo]
MVEVLWTTTCPGWGLRPWWGEALLASLCEPNRKGLRRSGHVKSRGAWAVGRGHYWETGARQHRRGWTRIHMDQMRVRRLIVPQTHVPLRTHHGQHRAVLRCLSALEPLHTKQGLQWNLRKILTSRCAGSLTIMVFCRKRSCLAPAPMRQSKKCQETWRADKQMHGSIYKGVPLQVRGQVKSCLLDTEKDIWNIWTSGTSQIMKRRRIRGYHKRVQRGMPSYKGEAQGGAAALGLDG